MAARKQIRKETAAATVLETTPAPESSVATIERAPTNSENVSIDLQSSGNQPVAATYLPTKPKIIDTCGQLERKQIEDQKLVTGVFIYPRKPGGTYRTHLRKYKGEPLDRLEFTDGNKYTIPLWMARWLNGDASECGCAAIIHEHGMHELDRDGKPKMTATTTKRAPVFRFVIQS